MFGAVPNDKRRLPDHVNLALFHFIWTGNAVELRTRRMHMSTSLDRLENVDENAFNCKYD